MNPESSDVPDYRSGWLEVLDYSTSTRFLHWDFENVPAECFIGSGSENPVMLVTKDAPADHGVGWFINLNDFNWKYKRHMVVPIPIEKLRIDPYVSEESAPPGPYNFAGGGLDDGAPTNFLGPEEFGLPVAAPYPAQSTYAPRFRVRIHFDDIYDNDVEYAQAQFVDNYHGTESFLSMHRHSLANDRSWNGQPLDYTPVVYDSNHPENAHFVLQATFMDADF